MRLLPLALGVWLGALVNWQRFLVLILAVLIVFRIRHRQSRVVVILLVAAFMVSALGLEMRSRAFDNEQVSSLLDGQHFTAIAYATSDPKRIRERIYGQDLRRGQFSLPVRVEQIVMARESLSVRFAATVFYSTEVKVIPGRCVRVSGSGARFGDQRPLIRADRITVCGRAGRVQEAAAAVRNGLRQSSAHLWPDARGLLPGLVVGDTARVSPSLEAAMREVNLAHLTAVSGANLAIVAGFVLMVARGVGIRREVLPVVIALALAFFVVLARPDPSVLRAAVMAMVLLAARALGTVHAALSALAFAVCVLILANPDQASSPGFILSVSATAGLIVWAKPLAERMERRLPRVIANGLAVPIAAQAGCTPFLVAYSGQLSLLGIGTNFIAAPFVAPATILGLLAGIAALIWQPIGTALATAASVPVALIAAIARSGAALPFASVPMPEGWLGAAISIALVALTWFGMRRHLRPTVLAITALTTAVVALSWAAPGWPMRDWAFVACDVGQGDGLVIRIDQHRAVVVDVGPDGKVMRECLEALHVDHIEILFITHAHADHMEGIPEILRAVEVNQIILPSLADPPEQYERLVAFTSGHRTRVVRYGERFTWPDVQMNVLWPRSQIDEGSAANNSSTVLLADLAGLRVLLLADVEREAQSALDQVGRVDLVKIAHHGSANQRLSLLDQALPEAAVISVGRQNPYGHPAPSLLRALARRGIAIFRTDLVGAIAVAGSQGAIRVRPRGHPFWIR